MSQNRKSPPVARARPQTIGDRLRGARLDAGYKTAGDAARALGVSPPTYYAHENGTRKLKGESVVAYAEAFGVPVGWLMVGGDDGGGAGVGDAAAEAPADAVAAPPVPTPVPPPAAVSPPVPDPAASARAVRKPPGYYTLGGRTPREPPPPPPPPPAAAAVTVPVVAEARRGYFIDPKFAPTDLGEVTLELPPGEMAGALVALRVADASMDHVYPQGSVVICRKLSAAAAVATLKVGDHVAVRTQLAGLTEHVVAEIRPRADATELHFHTDDGLLRGSEDYYPDQLLSGQSVNPFTRRQREIVGIVVVALAVS